MRCGLVRVSKAGGIAPPVRGRTPQDHWQEGLVDLCKMRAAVRVHIHRAARVGAQVAMAVFVLVEPQTVIKLKIIHEEIARGRHFLAKYHRVRRLRNFILGQKRPFHGSVVERGQIAVLGGITVVEAVDDVGARRAIGGAGNRVVGDRYGCVGFAGTEQDVGVLVIGEQIRGPAIGVAARGIGAVVVTDLHHVGHPKLPDIIGAFDLPRALLGPRQGGQQHARQDANDRDDHQ